MFEFDSIECVIFYELVGRHTDIQRFLVMHVYGSYVSVRQLCADVDVLTTCSVVAHGFDPRGHTTTMAEADQASQKVNEEHEEETALDFFFQLGPPTWRRLCGYIQQLWARRRVVGRW